MRRGERAVPPGSDGSRVVLALEIEPSSEPIRGTVHGPADLAQSFHGWIQLTELIEEARRTRDEEPS